MRRFIYFLFFSFIFLSPSLKADRIKAALKQLEKGEYEKARELIEKDLEKDSTNAGAYYILSLYFSNSQNPHYYIDSAYVFVLNAIQFLPQTEEKVVEDWNKIHVNDSSFQAQKILVEKLAFEWTLKVNQIEEYQHFIRFYSTAKQIPEVIRIRDALAWENALKKNTEVVYQNFMDTYPRATQFSQAKNKRDQFVYERETKGNTLEAFETFVKQYPNNDFRKEAEGNLFEIFTVAHHPNIYESFIQKYPTSSFVPRAYDWIFSFELQNKNIETVLKKYPNYPKKEKLRNLSKLEEEVFLTIYQNEKYGFVTNSGNIKIEPKFEKIIEDYRCESIDDLYFIFIQNQKQGLMDKTGQIVIPSNFDKLENLGNGIFKTQIGDSFGIYQQMGFEILPVDFQEVKLLAEKYLKVKKDSKWGVYSMNGRKLLKAQLDEIELLGENFIRLEKNGKYLIKQKDKLTDWIQNPNINLEVSFDAVELKNADFVEVQKNEKRSIFNLEEELIFPFQNSEIHYSESVWTIPKDSLFQEVFMLSGKKIELDSIQAVTVNENFIALKKNNSWQLFNSEGQKLKPVTFDSIALHQDIALFFQKKATWATFQNGEDSVNLSKYKEIKIIRGNEPNAQESLAFKANSNRWGLLNSEGAEIIKATYYQGISILDSNLILGKYRQLEGLLNFRGEVILKAEYEGISQLPNGYLGLLSNRKFGLFHPEKNILVPANYEVIPEPYSNKGVYFIVQKDKKTGLINQNNEILIPFDFEEIHFWQPEIALVKNENAWQFYDIQKKQLVKDMSFETITFVKSTLEEVIFIPNQENLKFGLWNNQVGEVLEINYDWLENINSLENPVFLVENKSEKSSNYQIQYISSVGEILWEATLSEEEYEALICP